MYDMHITHIGRSSDAIGARVKGKNETFGYIIGTTEPDHVWCNDYVIQWDDGLKSVLNTRLFEIVIELVDGAKYMTMHGDIRTVHKFKHGDDFYFDYAELGGSDSKECIYPNGSTYHYDCGANLLKRVRDDETPRRAR